jgi:hypothetical protein
MLVLVDGLLVLQKGPCLSGPFVDCLNLPASDNNYILPATQKTQQLTAEINVNAIPEQVL